MTRSGRFDRARFGWALGYALLVVAIVWSMVVARQWALSNLATAESASQWETWREDVRQQQDLPAPVLRRVPKSEEPPALVLMRDYFVVLFVGAMLFCSLLYWVTAWFVIGALASPGAIRTAVDERDLEP